MGNPFVHLDLSTTDVAGAKQFYQQVFDWQYEEMPAMTYAGIIVGPGGIGGGMGQSQSPGEPPTWTAYVGVDNLRETIAKAEAAGATILVPYMEVGDMGWLGVFKDPQGATIGVWQSAMPAPPSRPAPAAKKKAAPAKKKAAPAKKKAAPAKKKAAPAKKKAAPAKKKPAGKKKR